MKVDVFRGVQTLAKILAVASALKHVPGTVLEVAQAVVQALAKMDAICHAAERVLGVAKEDAICHVAERVVGVVKDLA